MARRFLLGLGVMALGICSLAPAARAQNPAWPPPESATRADMMDPASWPDDPGYGYDVEGDGMSCIEGGSGRCWTDDSGGQWNMWSWIPPAALDVDGFRAEEEALGSGTWTDMAWRYTTGDKRVVIAVLDSGIKWDERDLVNQYYINQAELEAAGLDARCLPNGGAGDPDADGDGFLTMRDWFVDLSAAEADTLRSELDAMGNGNGVAEPGDLIVLCSDGNDDDANGYTDDISGWDFFQDDNDPNDDTRFGHGTGEARDSAAEGNNGMGDIGQCPGCRVLMVRVGDSFVVDAQDYAQGVLFATDSGASVVQEALGSLNNTSYMRRAQDYAYENDVLIVASAADENSRHHNMPGTSNHTLYVHAIVHAGASAQNSKSFLAFNNCTNYGGQLVLSAPGTGCSSEATGVTSGIAGLLYSASMSADRPGGPLDPPLRAEEARQLLLMNADDIHVPESQPDHPDYDERWYPSREGWDQRFGYGRVNTNAAVEAVWNGRIPPEVDVVYPDWFRVVYPDRTPTIDIRGRIAADRADSYDWTIEWAPGIEPDDGDFTELAGGSGETAAMDGVLTSWDVADVMIDNADVDLENRYTVTVRVRATASYGGDTVVGEQRRVFAIHRDPSLLDGFPVALGTRNDADEYPAASGEGSPKMADLDGDGDVEIVYGDTDGLLHVFQDDGSELTGFPVQLGRLRGLDPDEPDNVLGAAAYDSGSVPADDFGSSLMASPAVGDLDGDGSSEIVAATSEGDVYAVHADGTMVDGFPAGLPEVPSGDPLRGGPPSPDRIVERGIFGSPVLADLDSDDNLEIVVAGYDGQVHVFRADGTVQPGFPVLLTADFLWASGEPQPGRIFTSPAVGDVNDDGLLDILVGSNETGTDPNSGTVHLLHGDGNMHEGGAAHDNWPIGAITSVNFFPLVGEGMPSPGAMADVDDDGVAEMAFAGTAGQTLIAEGVQPPREAGETLGDRDTIEVLNAGSRGPLASEGLLRADRPLLNTFAAASFGDLDANGTPDFVTGGAGVSLGLNLAGGWQNEPFHHMIGVWDPTTQNMLPGYPRIIEDYLFFVNPTVGDVSGDGYPEVVSGSGGYYVHAWDACGREAEGWPKFVGSWVIASVALGDVDGDDLLEAAVTTRTGYLWVFDTDGPADGALPWPEFRHDNRNTANHEMPLSNGGSPRTAAEPIDCPIPETPDAGMGDAGTGDAGADAGTGSGGSGGCGCRTAGGSGAGGASLLGLLALAVLRRRARRTVRRSERSCRR